MDITEQAAWLLQNPPSHLKAVSTDTSPDLGLASYGGHSEDIAISRRLTCPCGNQKFAVDAYLWHNGNKNYPSALISPVRATCSKCSERIVVFDCALHGYDAVVSDFQSTAHGEQEVSAVEFNVAPLSDPQTVDVVLYYPDDLFEEDFEEFADRRGDLFTWIKIVVGENIKPAYPFIEFECA